MKNKNIAIYKTEDNQIELNIHLDENTVWLSQAQMAELFKKDVNTIIEHTQNVYKEGELDREATTRKFRVVQKEGQREVSRRISHYNLDVIISVGYRVRSLRGTQFRIWATNVLRNYLVEGYAINQKQLESDSRKYLELQSQLSTLRKVVENESLNLDESKELIRIISDYSSRLDLLDRFDNKEISIPKGTIKKKACEIHYKEAVQEIDKLRERFGAKELFGNEKDDGFKSALKTIFQTFDEKELYPSLEEKAANLLYLIIKNHPFSDGNKRIGSFMFVRFLDINDLLYRRDGTKLVEDNALVAMALLIAQSDPRDKELMVRLVVNLIQR
ncbi:cytochrome C biogenesis protein CycH [Candidatus Dojkabacteria bacterium]|nr:cytochrome C biogenesis protein CycH [Candidatus Dojkabacteria bacterium]